MTARAVSMTLPLPVAVPPMTGTASLAGSAEFRIESESQSRFRGYMPFSMVQSRLQALLDALGNADNDESVLKAYDSFEVAAFAFDWSHVTGNRAGGRLTGTPQAGFKLESESDSEAGCSGDLPASRVATVGLPGRRDVTFTSLPVVSVIVALADAITTSALEVQLPIQDHDGPAAAYYRSANDPGRRMAASESGESEGNATVAASGDDTGTNLKLEGATAPTTTRTMGGHGQDGIGSDGNGVSPASATVMVVGRGPGTSGDQSATRTQTSSTRLAAAGLGDFEHVGNGVVVRPQCLWAAVLLRRFTRLALAAHCGVGHRTAQAAKSRMLDVLDALLARLPMTPTKPLTAKLVFELLCAREAVLCMVDTGTTWLAVQDTLTSVLNPGKLLRQIRSLVIDFPSRWHLALLELEVAAESVAVMYGGDTDGGAARGAKALQQLQIAAAADSDWRLRVGMADVIVGIAERYATAINRGPAHVGIQVPPGPAVASPPLGRPGDGSTTSTELADVLSATVRGAESTHQRSCLRRGCQCVTRCQCSRRSAVAGVEVQRLGLSQLLRDRRPVVRQIAAARLGLGPADGAGCSCPIPSTTNSRSETSPAAVSNNGSVNLKCLSCRRAGVMMALSERDREYLQRYLNLASASPGVSSRSTGTSTAAGVTTPAVTSWFVPGPNPGSASDGGWRRRMSTPRMQGNPLFSSSSRTAPASGGTRKA